MFGLTTRGQLDPATQLEFERLYARLTEFLTTSFNEDGTLIESAPDTRVVGEVIDFAGPTAPDKWLMCNGSQVSRITYKGLFEVIGTTYGAGDGSTTFNLPDARGRFTLCKAASGTGSVLGATGGSLDHTHSFSGVSISGTTSANGGFSGSTGANGGHSHSFSGTTNLGENETPQQRDVNLDGAFSGSPCEPHSHNFSGSTDSASDHTHTMSVGDHTHTFSASGSGTTDSTNPAYIVFNKIIYTGVSV